ncbi:hypothetical protein ACH3XW_5385 [Acanthocheilonema viteae]
MDLLDQIVIFRGCEPSVIISYIAIVREVYLHACSNLKKEDISTQERKTRMLEQWRQIEKHFAKIKYAMLDCWPIGNESDLMAAYVSIALLYSLYKDVCDEGIIRQCYEAAGRARKCGRANLSESQFNEVQQYCDMIENIFFLRRQRSMMNNDTNEDVNNSIVNDDQSCDNNDIGSENHLQLDNQQQFASIPEACIKCDSDNLLNCHSALGRIKDGPAILAEYGQLTTAGKTPTSEKICQKRLLPSNFEIKTAQKKLKYQKPTILTEFEAVLLARNGIGNGEFEFPRPSDLKLNRNLKIFKSSLNSRHYAPKSKLSNVCQITAENLGSIKTNFENLNSSNSVHQVLESSLINPTEDQSFMNQKENKIASITNITNKDTVISESLQGADTSFPSSIQDEISETEWNIGGFIKHTETNMVFSKIESYANEFVGKIIHSVIKVNYEPRKCSRRNSETIQITDTVTSTLLTANNSPTPKQQGSIDGSEEVGVESDGMNKNISIQTKRIPTKNINQHVEDVIIKSTASVITDPNSNDMLTRDKYNSEGMSDRMIVVEDYAEMELSRDQISKSFCNLQQTSESISNSGLSSIPLQAKLPTSVRPDSITTLSNSADLGNKSMRNRKQMETDSVVDISEERNKKEEKVQNKLNDGDAVLPDHINEIHRIVKGEGSYEKFREISKPLQKLKTSKQRQLSVGIATPIITDAKFPPKQAENQTDSEVEPDDAEKKYTVTTSELLASRENLFSGVVSSGIRTSNEVNPSASNNQSGASTGQMETAALIHFGDFNCSSDNSPMQMLNYSSDMSLMEIIPKEQFGTTQIKSQNELLDKEMLFEKYTNFEPPSCRLQKTPEFDSMPLSTEQLLSKPGLQFQMFPTGSTHQNQIRHHLSISHSQGITEETDNYEAVWKSFSDIVPSSSGETELRAIGFSDISTAQIEFIVEPSLQEQDQALLTSDVASLISSPSLFTINNSESSTSSRTDQESIMTKSETNEYIASEQKIGKEIVESKLRPILKEIFDKKEFCFTRNNNKYHQEEEIRLEPEIQQTSLYRRQIAPACQRLNNLTSVSSKPPLPCRPKHLFMTGKKSVEAIASEASFTFSDCDDKKSGFSTPEICQASSSQETGLLDTSEEKSSEPEKSWDDTINTEEQNLENKLASCKERSNEQMNDDEATKTSSTSEGTIQIPHFDAKAEFDRRLSVKKGHRGEVPVIVKTAILKSKNKLRLSRCLTDELLISPTLRLSASEKPDFNFIIRKK